MAQNDQTKQSVDPSGLTDPNGIWGKVLAMKAAQDFMQQGANGQTAGVQGTSPMSAFMSLMNIFSSVGQSSPQDAQANTEQKAKEGEAKTQPKPKGGGGAMGGFMQFLEALGGGGT